MNETNIETIKNEETLRTEVEEPPTSKTEIPPSATAAQVDETNRILKDVQDKLSRTSSDKAPTRNQVRELIREKTGLSDASIDWVMNLNREVVTSAVAPLEEKIAWSDLKSSKSGTSHPVTSDIEKEMKEELKEYPAERRGDSVLLEKVYLLAIGKLQVKGTKSDTSNTNPVVGRRIVSNNPTPGGNGGGSKTPDKTAAKLSDEEKTIARKMGVSEVDYAKYKGNPVIQGR